MALSPRKDAAQTAAQPSQPVLKDLPQERIIFCIDLCDEVLAQNFSKSKKGPTRLELIKKSILTFIDAKRRVNEQHQFAVCILTSATLWYTDFTSEAEVIRRGISSLEPQGNFTTFDMASLFSTIYQQCPGFQDKSKLPPNTIYRAIAFYSRSNVIPELKLGADLSSDAKALLTSPYFYFDILFMHSKPSKDNKTQQIFDFFTDIENLAPKDQYYYISESCTKPRFHVQVAQLVAHPRLRPPQANFVITQLDKFEEPKKK